MLLSLPWSRWSLLRDPVLQSPRVAGADAVDPAVAQVSQLGRTLLLPNAHRGQVLPPLAPTGQ